jgi:solute carrier family 25 carnitine/acylcarnitine transporter 20/29
VTDAVLMGSLHNYRRWLKEFGLTERDPNKLRGVLGVGDDGKRLTLLGHSIAGECPATPNECELVF